jgi:glycolate oxidase iron-sulfur subunit
MQDMHKLLAMLQELDDQLTGCMRCGMCQAVCPLYATTGRETDVARGKIALLDGLARKMLEDPYGVQERLNSCLLCGSCAAACPSGVKALDIFLKARVILTEFLGLSPAKKLIFRGLIANPKLFNTLTSIAATFQGLVTKPVNDMLGASCARFNLPVLAERRIAPLSQKPFLASTGELNMPKGVSGLRIAFFPGCVVDKIYPRVGEACLKVFRHHQVGVFMPKIQACCGIPALSSGDRKTYENLVAANLALFGPGALAYDYLITPCATCASTIKKIWPLMAEKAPKDIQDAIKDVAAKTMDVTEFLVDKLGLTAPEPNAGALPVTYHDPCHLKKSLGVAAQPRTVLRLNPNYKLAEMADADACCGCGGSFTLQHYELSKLVGGRKRDNILASKAGIAATGCPACMLQLTDMLSQAGARVQVKHAVELYAESLPGA